MSLTVNTVHLSNFRSWLISQKYQNNTVRNYLMDLNNFLTNFNFELSEDSITKFIASDAQQNNHSRHLASISKFCQFALDQQLITSNIFSLAKKHYQNPSPTRDLNLLLSQFNQSLAREHKSPITIKNYLYDIRQYIRFCESKTL